MSGRFRFAHSWKFNCNTHLRMVLQMHNTWWKCTEAYHITKLLPDTIKSSAYVTKQTQAFYFKWVTPSDSMWPHICELNLAKGAVCCLLWQAIWTYKEIRFSYKCDSNFRIKDHQLNGYHVFREYTQAPGTMVNIWALILLKYHHMELKCPGKVKNVMKVNSEIFSMS